MITTPSAGRCLRLFVFERGVFLVKKTILAIVVILTSTSCAVADLSAQPMPDRPWRDQLTETRNINSLDLISLRDIGGYIGDLTVSPDGAYTAFLLQSPELEKNRYRSDWYVVENVSGAKPVFVGDGGEVVFSGEATGSIGGVRIAMSPLWSSDSKWIAYKVKQNDQVQLWRSRRDGKEQHQLTLHNADVRSFVWSYEDSSIYYHVGPTRSARSSILAAEGQSGFLLDDRFDIGYSTRPIRPTSNQLSGTPTLWTYHFAEKTERLATKEEKKEYERLTSPTSFLIDSPEYKVHLRTPSADGFWHALLINENPNKYAGFNPPLVLYILKKDGEKIRCSASQCRGRLESLMWSEDNRELYFFRQEGVNYTRRSLYAWEPGDTTVTQLMSTDDLITNCARSRNRYVCLHESTTTHRKIVRIQPRKAEIETIFDPNPHFKALRLPQVEKLEWKEASGADAAGHLVYPIGYREGERYPLVIVQYRSRGFLRGGVGDEYPIYPLSSEGFFVLSFDRPENHQAIEKIGDPWELERLSWGQGFWERESALSALEVVIDSLVERGLIDQRRVGITGLSDGAETAWYAMIHSDKFAAAAVSDGGWSPSWYYLINSELRQNYFDRAAELPPPGSGNLERWRRISPEFHADKINTPILVQVADHELVQSVAGIGALQDAGQPVEAYVFPNEYHVKWQPKHKLAVYNRTIDWFNFWLRDVEDPNAEKVRQYARWRKMKEIKSMK